MRFSFLLLLLVLFSCKGHTDDPEPGRARGTKYTITVDGLEREYILYKPDLETVPANGIPLVIALHGGNGTAAGTEWATNFSTFARTAGWMVLYPQGIKKSYAFAGVPSGNDPDQAHDDVRFVQALIDKLIAEENADPKHIHLYGISRGGMFAFHLASKLRQPVNAIVSNIGILLEASFQDYQLPEPVSLMMINGVEDPLVPYAGDPGDVNDPADGGLGVEETCEFFAQHNGCPATFTATAMPNPNSKDQCQATQYSSAPCTNNREVVYIKVEGGGHVVPGGNQYLPKSVIGRACKDFNGYEESWSFMRRQSRLP